MDDKQDDAVRLALAARLRECAAQLGWSQAKLGRQAGIVPQLIGAYWHGKKRPSRDNLIALSDALGVDPRWLVGGVNGTASRLLDQIDSLIEAGDDDAVRALRPQLEGIAHDPDLAAGLQSRADYLLVTMGDKAAGVRRRSAIRKFEETSAYARQTIVDALNRAETHSGVNLGDGLRTAILSLAGQLLFMKPEGVHPDAMHWSFQGLVDAIIARIDAVGDHQGER